MRRSGAPSQLLGNASKKPRFVAPGSSSSCLLPESKPLTPKLGLSNALEKVQRSLAAPAQSKTEYEAQPKAAQPATAVSKALARVLCATESKENEAKTENPDNGSEEYTGDSRPADGVQLCVSVQYGGQSSLLQLHPLREAGPVEAGASPHPHPGGAHQQACRHRGQEQVLGHCGRAVQRFGRGQTSSHCSGPQDPLQETEGVSQAGSDAAKTRPARVQSEHLRANQENYGDDPSPVSPCARPRKGPGTAQRGSSHVSAAAGSDSGCSQDGVRYFSVMWCKASKKKHKRWEGDAVLVTRGRTATLKDMEGKDIGKGSGYKVSVLASLSEGETLMIGGKEVEVMGVISPEDFARGRCFQEVPVETEELQTKSAPPPPARRLASKPFCPPTMLGRADHPGSKAEDEHTCRPRHDALAPGALVMPRPSPNHQWSNNKLGLPVVDVVVDPYLTTHLRPHQRDGLLFLYECVMGMRAVGRYGAILADEMGLGKTLQSVALSWTLLKQGPYGGKPVAKRILVVTPGSLVQNWGAEFSKVAGPIEQFLLSPLHSVLVISYEMLLRCLEQVQKVEFGLVICDEGHRLKNSSIKTSSALSSLSCNRRVILTGTPVQNDLQEFYAIIEFVNPGILGSSTAYRKVYEEPILRSRQPSCTDEERVLGEERAAELSRLTGMFILRRTQEIINRYLPPRLDWTLFCDPSPLQRELYKHLLCHRVFRACLQGSVQTHTHLACITALKKLCNHPGLLHSTVKERNDRGSVESSLYDGLVELFPESYSSGGFDTADSGKLLVLSDLLTAIRQLSPSDRVVVVSNYTKTLDLLQDLCVHLGYTFCRLDGHTPTNQRQRLVDSFNSPYSQNFLFLLSSKAGGVGLNLVGASHLVLYDIDWNPANDIQAMARVWRDGQKKTVHIYRLLTAGTIEERIFQRQVSKQGLSGTVVDLGKGAEHTSFSTSELRDLFSLTDTPSLTHELLNCSCSMDGSVQAVAQEDEQVSDRPCQLGRQGDHGGAGQKHLSMSELMQWRHFSGDTHTFSDPYLDYARNNITFAFQTTISQTTQ
ncbi:DNA repair and recombination protein RAD54B [Nibea albiflora]|uniref:DNA repair and recombination protein RAD54B n=1 Tax=Nibea albiflora TaxID=240163 RepID=A0ACB7F7F5_NIBAL|nr:DNA repair and recombination protein RAD54B [Nibea albiflora]